MDVLHDELQIARDVFDPIIMDRISRVSKNWQKFFQTHNACNHLTYSALCQKPLQYQEAMLSQKDFFHS